MLETNGVLERRQKKISWRKWLELRYLHAVNPADGKKIRWWKRWELWVALTLFPGVPIMLGDAKLAGEMAGRLLEKGVYVVAFSYPVVPKDKARIRVQVSAAHTREDLRFAVDAFTAVKRELGSEKTG
jgi:hypothetical protein